MKRLIVFFKSASESCASEWQVLAGGIYTLAVRADRFPSYLDFEQLNGDGVIVLNSANINAEFKGRFDLGVGEYRMNASGDQPLNLTAMLVHMTKPSS